MFCQRHRKSLRLSYKWATVLYDILVVFPRLRISSLIGPRKFQSSSVPFDYIDALALPSRIVTRKNQMASIIELLSPVALPHSFYQPFVISVSVTKR